MVDKSPASEETKKPVPQRKRHFVHPVKSVLATDNKAAKEVIKKLVK